MERARQINLLAEQKILSEKSGLVSFVWQSFPMVHNLWCTSQDCLNLSQLVLHLRTRISLTKDVVNRIASYLKLPRLNILARTDMYVSNKIGMHSGTQLVRPLSSVVMILEWARKKAN